VFFLCLNHLQWVSLLFAISPLQSFAVSCLVAVKKRKKQKKKRIAHPKGGEIQRVGSYHLVFCVCVFCFLLFLVCFLRPYGEGLADKKVAGPTNYLPLLPPQALQTCFWLFIVCWGLRFH
jgi:hypothetical protein